MIRAMALLPIQSSRYYILSSIAVVVCFLFSSLNPLLIIYLSLQKPKLSEVSSKEYLSKEGSSKEVSSKKAKNKAIAGVFLKKALSEKEHNEKRQKLDSEGMCL